MGGAVVRIGEEVIQGPLQRRSHAILAILEERAEEVVFQVPNRLPLLFYSIFSILFGLELLHSTRKRVPSRSRLRGRFIWRMAILGAFGCYKDTPFTPVMY